MKKLSILLILLFLSIIPTLVNGQRATIESKFDKIIEQNMKDWHIAGLSIVVVKDNAIILNKGYGHKDVQLTEKVTNNTLFAMGSSAKAFTGALIAQADTDSLLNLNTPVSKQTSFKLIDEVLTQQVTFKDLLTHHTGIPGHDFIWLSQNMTRNELSDRLQYLPKTKGLRQAFQYNNILYAIAGYKAADILHTTWEDAMQDKIFKPLGMNHTGFEIPANIHASDYTAQFLYNGASYLPLPFRDLSLVAPAGGVYTNTTDLSYWLLMLLNNGKLNGKTILDEVTLKKMFHPYVVSIFPKKFEEHFYENYGLGWAITSYRGLHHIHHAGNIDGFTSTVDLFPDHNIGIAILTNTAYANTFTDIIKYDIIDELMQLEDIDWSKKYKDLIALKKMEHKPAVINHNQSLGSSAFSLDQLTGEYHHDAYGTIVVSKQGDGLSASYGQLPLQLQRKEGNTFTEMAVVPGQHFTFEGKDKASSLTTAFPSSEAPIIFSKVK